MLGREGWRKQGLVEDVQAKLGWVLQLEEEDEEEEGREEGREGGVEGVLAVWGLAGKESLVDVVLGRWEGREGGREKGREDGEGGDCFTLLHFMTCRSCCTS
jgi:hypothetical protein